MPTKETKHPVRSVTVWGTIIAFLGLVLQALGVGEITGAEQATAAEQIVSLIDQALILFGTITALVGRLKANTKLSTKTKVKTLPVLICSMLLFAAGCNTSTRQAALDTAEASSVAMIRLSISSHQQGLITDKQLAEFYRLHRPAAGAMVAARSFVDTEPETFDQWMEIANTGAGLAKALLIDYGIYKPDGMKQPTEPTEPQSWMSEQHKSPLHFYLPPLKTPESSQNSLRVFMPRGNVA